ncbi:putative lipid II flippase FtsW [Desulfocucumis palustris]|nr:putative lipid II flippase FtsW [Desulfocucumis palustris]
MMAKKKSPDFILFITVMMLLSVGIVMVFSSSSYYAMFPPFNNPFHFLLRQLVHAVIGVFIMGLMVKYDYHELKRWAKYLLITGFVLLLAVLTPLGESRLGAQRWLNLGFYSFQPSELVKFCIIVFTAYGLSRKRDKIQSFTEGMLPFLMVAGAAGLLILKEPDLGTAMTLVATIFVMMFAAGVRISHIIGIGAAGVGAVLAAIFSEEYRYNRFMAFLDPQKDPSGAGWQILNSLMSIGSGGLLGTGLGQGRHSKFLYLPERQTDFIFAVIGEELGFIGGALVILLFIMFIWRGFKIAITAPDSFGSLLAAGIVSGIGLQAIINLGVVTSTLPVTGITLPFLSFGGTSLVFTLMGVGVLLNISRYITPK